MSSFGDPPPPPPPFGGGGTPPPPPPNFPPASPPGFPPGQGYPPMGGPTSKTNGMSIASLVLGILSIPCCSIFLPAVLALIFGFVGINQIKNDQSQKGRGMAIAGISLGAASIVLVVLIIVFGDLNYQLGENQFGN